SLYVSSPSNAAMDSVVVLLLIRPFTPVIYTLSLHDALPISRLRILRPLQSHGLRGQRKSLPQRQRDAGAADRAEIRAAHPRFRRSEEHTSELQSRRELVCRLLLEKEKASTSSSTLTSER